MRSLALIVLAACSKPPAPIPVTPSNFTTLAADVGVTVAVEQALYETTSNPHFFVHVRVSTTRPVSADLKNHVEVFYPNQWGASNESRRSVIDERRLVLPPFDPGPTIAAHASLTAIAANASLDYFVEFNANGRGEVDAQSRGSKFVIVTMDGQLRVSDGKTAERLVPSDDSAREIALAIPIAWKPIPPGARIIVSR